MFVKSADFPRGFAPPHAMRPGSGAGLSSPYLIPVFFLQSCILFLVKSPFQDVFGVLSSSRIPNLSTISAVSRFWPLAMVTTFLTVVARPWNGQTWSQLRFSFGGVVQRSCYQGFHLPYTDEPVVPFWFSRPLTPGGCTSIPALTFFSLIGIHSYIPSYFLTPLSRGP